MGHTRVAVTGILNEPSICGARLEIEACHPPSFHIQNINVRFTYRSLLHLLFIFYFEPSSSHLPSEASHTSFSINEVAAAIKLSRSLASSHSSSHIQRPNSDALLLQPSKMSYSSMYRNTHHTPDDTMRREFR